MPISHHKAKANYETRVFALVNPGERSINRVSANDLYAAMAMVGIAALDDLDHGVVIEASAKIAIGFSVVVRGKAIFNNVSEASELWAVDRRLYSGPGVVYAHALYERAVDVPESVPVRFFASIAEVESEIKAARIDRPTLWEGPLISWQWPQPTPTLMKTA